MNDSNVVLLVSHKKTQCGVHQFGLAVAGVIARSKRYDFRYVECGSAEEYHAAVAREAPVAILYNHYPSTMPWFRRALADRHAVPHIGIMHEVTQAKADAADQSLFDFHVGPDPTLLLNNPIVFKTGRLVPRFTNRHAPPAVPTIGSFGFGTAGKGFERLIAMVQDQFDRATIRLNIPFASFGDADGAKARAVGDQCRALVTKAGITLDLRHDFMSVEELLEFLAQNSLNAFLYEYQDNRGISSVVDYALAVKRPLAITKSSMFRHVNATQPPITVEDARLSEILQRGFAPVSRYAEEWTEENLCWDYERIVDAALRAARAAPPLPVGPGRRLARAVTGRVAATAGPWLRRAEQRLVSSPHGQRLMRGVQRNAALTAGWRALRARVVGSATHVAAIGSADWMPHAVNTVGELSLLHAEPYAPIGKTEGLNRILDQGAFTTYAPAVEYLFRHMPELMARKMRAANIQQAFVLDTVMRVAAGKSRPRLLCVGSYEDTAAGAIMMSGLGVDEVDPVINYDLTTFMTKPSCRKASYDVVFATSVIEHVADDETFLKHFEELLAPGGVGVLTCDFNDQYRVGDRLPVEDRRFYTRRDLLERLLPVIPRCELVDQPRWECETPDFEYSGCRYTFATLVFRRVR